MGNEATRFKKGMSGNPNGSSKISKEIKKIKRMNRDELTKLLDKYSVSTMSELKKLRKDTENVPAIDLIVISNIILALEKDNANSRDFIVDRMCGKVREELKVEGSFGHKRLLDQIGD